MERKELIKKILRETEDLDFLSSYHKKASDIGTKIKQDLPKMGTGINKITKNFGTVPLSSLDKSWNTSALWGTSETLTALADKIQHMIHTGKAEGIKRMIDAIVTGREKTLYRIAGQGAVHPGERESLGKGHFRWNYRAYQLTPNELEQVKNFFGYN